MHKLGFESISLKGNGWRGCVPVSLFYVAVGKQRVVYYRHLLKRSASLDDLPFIISWLAGASQITEYIYFIYKKKLKHFKVLIYLKNVS